MSFVLSHTLFTLTENAQKEQLVKILEEYVAQLKGEMDEAAAENPFQFS